MNGKNLLTINDLEKKDIFDIIKVSEKLKKYPLFKNKALKNRSFALLFQKPSNRTRISFEVGIVQLGGYALYLSPQEIDMGGRESVKDVACVISRYADGVVARVFSHSDIEIFARYSDVPVINGLSDFGHPCQALSDIFTVYEKFGSFRKVKFAFVGDGNNVLNSLLMAGAKVGMKMNIATPAGYEPSDAVLKAAREIAGKSRASIEVFSDPAEAVKGCNVVYTDVWTSMGQEGEREKRIKDFTGFQVNKTLMSHAARNAVIMHCLPAHRGEEITDVIDGKGSIIYDQAENRMHVQKAIMLRTFSKRRWQ